MKRLDRRQMAKQVARDLPKNAVVNLGIGMPTQVTDCLAAEHGVFLHSENGILGMRLLGGDESPDVDLINASKQFVSALHEWISGPVRLDGPVAVIDLPRTPPLKETST